MEVTIRPATHADSARIAPIYNFYLGKATQDTERREPAFFTKMMDNLEARETLLVVEKGNVLAGFGYLKKYSWKEGYRYTGEISLFFDGKYWGLGLGKQLMQRLIDQAKNWEYRHLVARIMALNIGSITFHKKLGYEIVGTQRQIGFLNGQWHDAVIMQLIIPE